MGARKTTAELDREIRGVLASSANRHSLTYHAIGGDTDPWPPWLLAYEKACGVYVIRDKGSKSVLYVGSSKARLYDTVTRHFQQWKRTPKGRKKAKYSYQVSGAGHDPGLTYSRGRSEVAIRLVPCGSQLDEEAALIAKLKPRDNLVKDPSGSDDDVIPF